MVHSLPTNWPKALIALGSCWVAPAAECPRPSPRDGGVTYDTGALTAAERNDRRMWALHAALLAEEVVPTVPAAVLAEAWRGGSRQASLSRLLALCAVEDMTSVQAKAVGVLAGRSGHDDVVDVAVVEGALRRGDAVVTANRAHLAKVAEASRTTLVIEDV